MVVFLKPTEESESEELGGKPGRQGGWERLDLSHLKAIYSCSNHLELLSLYRETRCSSPLHKSVQRVLSRTWEKVHNLLLPLLAFSS